MKLNNIMKSLVLLSIITTIFSSTLHAKDRNILAYKDRGIKYYPRYVPKGHTKIGKASWYGNPFHGRLTANGERYNMYGMTAAHRTYAMGTVLKVTNLRNKRSVRVRVNDRGPFYSSRNIDLSYGAAKKLGMIKKGVGKVKIQVLSSKGKSYNKKYKKTNKKKVKIAKKQYKKPIKSSKKSYKKSKVVAKKQIKRSEKIQIASFFTKKYATAFKKNHKLKNSIIVKKHLKDKKIAYRVIVNCTPWEAKKLLKSKKFSGALKLS